MKYAWVMVGVFALMFAGCDGDPGQQLNQAKPATGAALEQYSIDATNIVRLGPNADLVQRFCLNMSGTTCPTDIASKLAAAGFDGEGPANELGDAFAKLEADRMDGSPDFESTNEIYVKALYRVALGREPDERGEATNLGFLNGGNGRQVLMRAFMQSMEFKTVR